MNAIRRGLGHWLVQAFLVVIGLIWLTIRSGDVNRPTDTTGFEVSRFTKATFSS